MIAIRRAAPETPAGDAATSVWPVSTRRPPAPLVVLAALIAAAALLPVVYLLAREGLDIARLRDLLASPSTMPLLINTLLLMTLVTGCSVILGVALALLVVLVDLPGRRGWMVLFTLPLALPAFVTSYAWVAAGYKLAPTSTALYGLPGATLVLTLSMYPLVYLPVVAALHGMDAAHEEVARSLGRGRSAVFREILLPQLRWAISGGALVIALHMLAEYGALQLLRYQTLTTAIVLRATTLNAPEQARALSVVLAVCAFVVLAADQWLLRRGAAPPRAGAGAARRRTLWSPEWWTPLLLGGAALAVVLSLGVPLFAMIEGAQNAVRDLTAAEVNQLLGALGTTVRYGVLAAALVTLAGLPISVLSVRYPGRGAVLIERAAWVAHALPGVVVALALVFFSVRWSRPLYQTTAILIVGYAILYLPVAIGGQLVGVRQATRDFDDMARGLGRSPVSTWLSVTLPLALPGIATGAMLVLLSVSKELTMTLLLRPTGANTLATRLWTTTRGEVLDFTAAAPYAIGIMLVSAIPAVFLARAVLRSEQPRVVT